MLRILSLLFVISLSSVIARADIVTGGSYRFEGSFGTLTEVLAFGGTTFSANGVGSTQSGTSLPAIFTCFPCTSGTSVSLSSSALLLGGDFRFGTATVDGISHSLLTTTSDMTFSAGMVIVPITDDPFITLTAPFSLTAGSLHGPGFGVGFTGVGSASLSLRRIGIDASGNGLYKFDGLSYTFGTPVPEPASMLLLLTGVSVLPVMFRKRNPWK
jgi:hypothetical protein